MEPKSLQNRCLRPTKKTIVWQIFWSRPQVWKNRPPTGFDGGVNGLATVAGAKDLTEV
ncbi:hypothetical protein HanIR_Chr10g0493471 [Helianthus annuus]|nr:hypothetical protein HanIR_Chr10g0493471 [Helianthus annuus]